MPPAGQVSVVLNLNSANYTTAMGQAQKQLDVFAGKARGAGNSTVSSMQAASASIRALEDPLTINIRTLSRFAAQSSTLRTVFQAAFPIVGVLAAGAAVAKIAVEVTKAITEMRKMPQAITAGFGSLNLSSKTATDQLNLTNDSIQAAINKLEGKSNAKNLLATQLDEARLAADKLATSIEHSNAALNELLTKNHLSGWALLMGKQGTADREGTIKAFSIQSDSNAYDLANATTPAQTAAAKKALSDTQNAELGNLRNDLATRQHGEAGGPDNAANIAIDKGAITQILNQQRQEQAELQNSALEAQRAKDETAKAGLEAAKAAARLRLEAMEEALNAEKLQGNVSIKQVYDYWAARKSAFTVGSEAYNQVVAKQTQAAIEGSAKAHEEITRAISEQKRSSAEDGIAGPDIINRYAEASRQDSNKAFGEQSQGYLDSNMSAIDDARNDARDKEARLTDEAGSSLTRYAAALQVANVHTQEYVTLQTALQGILDTRIAQQRANPSADTDRAVTAAQVQLANARSQRGIQVQSDGENIYGKQSDAAVGFSDAINEFVMASRDAAAQMRDLTNNTLKGLNDTILGVLTTPHTTGLKARQAFGNYGAGLAKDVAGVGLQKAEGSLFGMIPGIGKMGTKGNPVFVTMDSVASTAGGAAGAGLTAALGAAKNAATTGGGSGLMTSLLGVVPFLASGGPISGPAVVGEQGPELFVPSTPGSIIPNHKLTSGSTGTGGVHFHAGAIDARGSNDPAQVREQITMALRTAAPMISAHTISAQKESQMRQPPGSRR